MVVRQAGRCLSNGSLKSEKEIFASGMGSALAQWEERKVSLIVPRDNILLLAM